jgi:hypothetical protein
MEGAISEDEQRRFKGWGFLNDGDVIYELLLFIIKKFEKKIIQTYIKIFC